jgi:hypothetical protein
MGLLSNGGPAGAAVAVSQATVPPPASAWARPTTAQQTAQTPGPPVASAAVPTDRWTIRTRENGTNAEAIDHLFARFTDGPEDMV